MAHSTTVQGRLKMAHVNIDGLRSKLRHIEAWLGQHRLDVLAVSGTGLAPADHRPALAVPGYTLHRRDAADRHAGGGLALYVRQGVPHARVPRGGHVDSLWLRLHACSLAVGVVHRPWGADDNYMNAVRREVAMVTDDKYNFVLMGELGGDGAAASDFRYIRDLEADFQCENLFRQRQQRKCAPTNTPRSIFTRGDQARPLYGVILSDVSNMHVEYDVIEVRPPVTRGQMACTVFDLQKAVRVTDAMRTGAAGYCDLCRKEFGSGQGVAGHRAQSQCGRAPSAQRRYCQVCGNGFRGERGIRAHVLQGACRKPAQSV